MRKQHQIYILSTLIVTLLMTSSCEKEINVSTPPFANELAINCNTPAYMPLYVYIGKSASIKDQKYSPDLTVPTAVAKLYVDGVYSETLVYTDSSREYVSTQATVPGKQYMIKVTAPGYTGVTGKATVPRDVAITNITHQFNARKDADGNIQDAVTITFTDPPGVGDYYIIKINGMPDTSGYQGGGGGSYGFCVNSPDAGIETNASDLVDANTCLDNNGIFIRDGLFDGKQKEMKLFMPSNVVMPQVYGTDTLYASIELLHVSEDYFRYMKSVRVAQDANDNPFSEPVNVYTNITNGLGIFTITNSDAAFIK